MQATKFQGSYEDQLELIFSDLLNHSHHNLWFSLEGFDQAKVCCGVCKKTVIEGSRELIELIWLEYNEQGSPS